MPNSEHEIRAASPVRAMHLNGEHPGCENWERRSREMMMRGKNDLSRRGSCIDGGHVNLRKKEERTKSQQKSRITNKTKRTKNKQKRKKEKQTKETERSKGRAEKQRRLMSAWTLLCELFRGFPGRLLRESDG
jgi:hypothetical protein